MRIIYLSSPPIPSARASSLQVFSMCDALAAEGYAVELSAPLGEARQDPFEYYQVRKRFLWRPLANLEGRSGYLWSSLLAAHSTYGRPKPDLVWARDALSLVLASFSGAPLILEMHQPPKHRLERILINWLFSRERLVRFVTNTWTLHERCKSLFPRAYNDEVWCAAFNGSVDFGTDSSERSGPERFQVGYVGSISPGKGLETLLKLAHRLPDIDFLVAAPEENKVGRPDNLHLLGRVSRALLPQLFARCDVMVAPYGKRVACPVTGKDLAPWTSSLKVVEYMSAGKAIIASDLRSLREVLTHDQNALLVPPEDLEGWAGALHLLKDDHELRERLANRARADFLEQHTWRHRVRRIMKGVG